MMEFPPKHSQYHSNTNQVDCAAVDPKTVPFVPKLLPPLPRIEPTNQPNVNQVCFQWNNDKADQPPSMVCFASSKAREDQLRNNPFSGLYINYLYGQKACDDYHECSSKGKRFYFDPESRNIQLDFGGAFERFKFHAHKISLPTTDTASKYLESWMDGTQSQFAKDYLKAVTKGDGIELAKRAWNSLSKGSSEEEN